MEIDIRTIVDIVVGSGLLGLLLFYESRKRKERALARNAELENINLVLEQKNSYIDDLKNEQTELKKEKEELRTELREARAWENKERNKVVTLYKQLSSSTIDKVKMSEEIDILRFHRCDKQECLERTPKRDI